ncbi:hypothetical protein AAFN47_18720 [Hoeflea sp. CAU 1731]
MSEISSRPKYRTKPTSDHYGIPEQTLNNWRCTGDGPPFYKVGRIVLYDWCEVDDWLKAKRRASTSVAA